MYDNVITLISETCVDDEYGDQNLEITERKVFAELKSIGQSEFYQAQSVGLKPEVKFVIADYLDYQNEKKIRFKPFQGKDEEYTVLRTYRNNNQLEIVCKRGIEQ